MLRLHPRDSITLEDVGVEVVVSPPSGVGLDPAREAFRAKSCPSNDACATNDSTFLPPSVMSPNCVREVAIWIGRRKCVFAQSEHNQRCVHVGLKAKVAMDVLGKLASATDETGRRIKREPRPRLRAALAGEPFSVVREEALTAAGHGVALLDSLDP
jgi:hypothetical protein